MSSLHSGSGKNLIILRLQNRNRMLHFPLRICESFKPWYLCIRYCCTLPGKESTLSRLVFRAMLGGVFVSILSAMIVGLITLF